MIITFVLPGWATAPVGGYKVVYEYANRLAELGHTTYLVHPLDTGKTGNRVMTAFRYARKVGQKAVRGSWLTFRRSGVRSIVTPNLEATHIPSADVVIATSWRTAECVADYPARCGNKFYFIQSYETWSGSKERVDATWRLPLKKIVISKWLRDIATQMGEQAVLVPNAIDTAHFRVTRSIEERNTAVVGLLYHEQAIKGFKYGFDALQECKRRHPELSAIVFGVPAMKRSLPSWVRFVRNPRGDTLRDLYNEMSIFVHTSVLEGWALPPAEAMACGCAVVAANNEGVREFAVDGYSALVVEKASSSALAQGIDRLLLDDSLRIRLASTGHDHIQSFSWTDSVEKFAAVLASVSGTGQHGIHPEQTT
jgi:glycosyltransferase involved in cell wall biosynthesis